MERIYCPIHFLDIIIYNKNEENLFIDDNKREVAIFYDDEGKKYLKRFIMGKCDINCPTVKQILEEE